MRENIQTKLNEIETIDSGQIVFDDIVETGTTYFGYSIQEDCTDTDNDKNRTIRVSIIGFLVRKNVTGENTLSIVDTATESLINKLKELNFKISSQDITQDNNIFKKKITGYTYYNEINNKLVI